jgi:hypothetical protein
VKRAVDSRFYRPAEFVDAIVAAEVVVANHLQPSAPVRRPVGVVAEVAVVGLAQVRLADRDGASTRVARKADDRVPADPRTPFYPAGEAGQVPREAQVLAIGGP